MISPVFRAVQTTFGCIGFLVAICCFDDALCNDRVADVQPPVFPPKSLELPYPRLLHERDVIRYLDAEGRFVSIGSGTFANVTLGELADSGVHVVIKSFRDSPFREILKEIRLHRYAEHLGITSRLIGLLPSGPLAGNISMVFEYIAYSKALSDWLIADNALTTVQWIYVCRQIALALLRLHQHDVLFNDLHRGNVLIEKQDNKLQVYLIDFGYATFRMGKEYSVNYGNFSGYNFIAPEMAQGSASTKATDVFALGYIFSKIAETINVIPLFVLAHWCKADDPSDRPQLLTVIAKLDSVLFGVKLMSWGELSTHKLEHHDLTSPETIDYFVLREEQIADVSTAYLFCPSTFTFRFVRKEAASEWVWLLQDRGVIFENCRVPLFVLDEHDLIQQDANDVRWVSHATHNALRLAQLKLTNQTVIVKEFYSVSFERVRSEACVTALFGEMDISPRLIGILIEYKKMDDIAFVQELYGNGVSVSKFISLTSGHEWDLEFLGRAAADNNVQHNASNSCPWSALQCFLGLINQAAVRICQAKSHRRLIMERISTQLVTKMVSIHNSGYLINNFRLNNVLTKANSSNCGVVDVDLRLIDLKLASSIHHGIYSDKSASDIPGFTYLAPEVLRGGRTSRSSDIFSLCFGLHQIMSDYFVSSTSSLASAMSSKTVHSNCSVYGNSTVQEITQGRQSRVKSSSLSESALIGTDTALLKYHHLLLKCLNGEPRDRPHIQQLLSVSSLAFS